MKIHKITEAVVAPSLTPESYNIADITAQGFKEAYDKGYEEGRKDEHAELMAKLRWTGNVA